MPISIYTAICAALTIVLIITVYLIFFIRRKNGKSDIRQARIGLVIASFLVPIIITVAFVIVAALAQHFYQFKIPVGKHGGGVFIVLITSVASSIATLILLIPRIKHKWED